MMCITNYEFNKLLFQQVKDLPQDQQQIQYFYSQVEFLITPQCFLGEQCCMQGKHGHTYEPYSPPFCLTCIWFPLCFVSNVSHQFLTLRNLLMQWPVFFGATFTSPFGNISNKLAPVRIILQMKSSVLTNQLHK